MTYPHLDYRIPASQAWQGSEHDLQTAVVSRLLTLAPTHPEILLLHAIPSGDWRGWASGKRLKAEGVIPGVPDLCLPVPRHPHHGLYLELKTAKGHVSREQWRVMSALHQQGYCVRVTNSLPVAVEIVTSYLKII